MTARARTVICLFRNDLRYHDNEILHWAARHGSHVVPLYCFDPRNHGTTWHFGIPKTGPHRLRFLLESVADLRKTLLQHGSGLVVRSGKPEEVIPQIISAIGKENTHSVVFHQEPTKEELDVEEAIKCNCGVPVESFWGSTLYHPEDVPFSIKQVPNVYTEFRKRVEGQGIIRRLINVPDVLPPLPDSIEQGEIPSIDSFGLKVPEPDARSALPLAGGETSALERLKHYLWDTDKVAEYKETRNGMIGADYSTKFSSWLAHGCISPKKIYYEIKRYEEQRTANQSTYWVIFELLWRDYFKFVALKFGDKLFYRDGLLGKKVAWKKDLKAFEAWKEGRTGVPYVDANMREVAATGFMSNRGRQNVVASFLTKDLQLDWRLGAEWFESMLVDHDVCSNYGNWQYSAGIGNDPRQDRKFNMVKQGLDYDANGDYIRLWVPELAGIKGGAAHTPWTMSPALLARCDVHLGENYPNPMIVAPEWNRVKRGGSGRPGSSRGGGARGRGQARGVDFYFKNKNTSR